MQSRRAQGLYKISKRKKKKDKKDKKDTTKNKYHFFRSANAYKDCGLTGWTEKADYVECIRAMAEVMVQQVQQIQIQTQQIQLQIQKIV